MAILPVEGYRVYFYGSAKGYKSTRANINLLNASGNIRAVIKFYDDGSSVGEDYQTEDIIWMHLPASMLHSVVDVLRNEKPIFVHFAGNSAFLSTSEEPIGEGDDDQSA
jgi:hypothetical protein